MAYEETVPTMTYEEAFPTISYEPIKVTMQKMKKGKYDTRPFEAEVCKLNDETLRFSLYNVRVRDYDQHHFRFENCLIEYNGRKYYCIQADREGYPKYPVLTAKLVA